MSERVSRTWALALGVLAVAACVLAITTGREARAAGTANQAPRKATTASVRIDATSFQPSVIVVRLGDSIEWANHDLFRHTVTSSGGGFDSKDIQPDSSWKFTPTKAGRYDYLCIYHGTMTGTVVVR